MAISALIEEFKQVSASPKTMLAKYKAQGKKAIGCLPYYVPEELVYAAGMVPMGVWGCNGKQEVRSKEYCASFYCTVAQLSLEMLLDGTLDGLDGIITPVRYPASHEPELQSCHERQDACYFPGSSPSPSERCRQAVHLRCLQ